MNNRGSQKTSPANDTARSDTSVAGSDRFLSVWRPVYYGLAGFWLLAGLASGYRLFYVLFLLQALLAAAALTMDLWTAFSFAFTQELSASQTTRGQPVHLHLAVHNEQLLPYPLMKIRLAVPGWPPRQILQFNLAARSHLSLDRVLDCPYRGRYAIGMTIMDLIDIFNLIRLPFDLRLLPYYRQPELVVYPLLHKLEYLPLPVADHKAFAHQATATADDSAPFSSVRAYRPGDSRRLIHWKVSLRQQTLLTRQFEQLAEPRIWLILDWQSMWSGEAACQAGDALAESAAALIYYLLRHRQPMQMIAAGVTDVPWARSHPDQHIRMPGQGARGYVSLAEPDQRGLADFERYYRWLATTPLSTIQDKRALSAALNDLTSRIVTARALLVLSTSLDISLVSQLAAIRRRGSPVVVVLAAPDPALAGPAVIQNHDRLQKQLQALQVTVWSFHYGQDFPTVLAQQGGTACATGFMPGGPS